MKETPNCNDERGCGGRILSVEERREIPCFADRAEFGIATWNGRRARLIALDEGRIGPFGSDFKDNGEDERTLGGLFVDVAFEIHADLFLDDRPIGALFSVGRIDGSKDDIACAGDQVTAVVTHETACDDFRLRLKFAGVLVDGDDGDNYTVFRKMTAIADDNFFDFLERA